MDMSRSIQLAEQQGRPIFAPPLVGGNKAACFSQTAGYLDQLISFCGAGSQVSEVFENVFQGTDFAETAGQFHNAMVDICAAVNNVAGHMKTKLEASWLELNHKPNAKNEEQLQLLAKCYLNVIRLHCQFLLTSTDLLSPFCEYRKIEDLKSNSSKQPDFHPNSVHHLSRPSSKSETSDKSTQPEVQSIWGPNFPQNQGEFSSNIYSNTKQYIPDGQTSQFGNIGSKSLQKTSGVVKNAADNNSHYPAAWAVETEKGPLSGESGHGITQEELDSVIDFLSGNFSGKMAISEQKQQTPSSNPICNIPKDASSSTVSSTLSSTSSSSSHRHSDAGLPVVDAKPEPGGRNTWPVNSNNTGTIDPNALQEPYSLFSASSFGSDPEFLNYVASIGALIGHSGSYDNNPIWSTAELKLNRSWPLQSQHSSARESIPTTRTWPNHGDSSSSDESANDDALLNIGVELAHNMEKMERRLEPGDQHNIRPPESFPNQPPLPPKNPWNYQRNPWNN